MIGCIVVGGLVAVGLAKIARHHVRRAWWCDGGGSAFHHRCGAHTRGGEEGADFPGGDGWGRSGGRAWFGGSPWHRRHSFGFGRRGGLFLLGGILRRLETTPTQNQALREAFKEFRTTAKAAKGEGRRTRADVAAAFRRPAVDAESLGEMYARHDTAMESVRRGFVGMMIKVHDILDDAQRERLAQLIEHGPRGLGAPEAGSFDDAW